SPGPIPCSALTTKRTTSESAISRLTRRCILSVSASRGRWTPGRSVITSCQSAAVSVATPRIARRVVCGRSGTVATPGPTIAVPKVDLPTFGRPATPANPDLLKGLHDPGLQLQHLAVVGLVVVAAEVKRPVYGGLGHVRGLLGTDEHVAELTGTCVISVIVDRESEDVGGLVDAAGRIVERPHPAVADDLHPDVAVADSGCMQ